MNARTHQLSQLILFAAIVVGVPLSCAAQDNVRTERNTRARPAGGTTAPEVQSGSDLTQGVYIASIDIENRSLRSYAGQKLWNTEGAELGTIKDFIVQPASSRVRYVVVSSGGVLGMGNSLRLVPVDVLQWSEGQRGLAVDILQSRWLQVPAVSDLDYVRDQLRITPAQEREFVRRFGGNRNEPSTAAETQPNEDDAGGLVRASVLRGKTVQVDGRVIGNIENIIVDLEARSAAALLDSTGEFTGTHAKYVIPISRLTFEAPGQNPITATLTRAEFDRARPLAADIRDRDIAPAGDEPPLAPTGR